MVGSTAHDGERRKKGGREVIEGGYPSSNAERGGDAG